MTNKNCLEGIRCPQCGDEDAFRIEAQITVYVTDDGTEDDGGHYAWDDQSPCRCAGCGHAGTIKDFTIENQENARLIEAASDMLEALEAAEAIISGLMAEFDEDENDVPSIVGIRAAIAKAKGGAA